MGMLEVCFLCLAWLVSDRDLVLCEAIEKAEFDLLKVQELEVLEFSSISPLVFFASLYQDTLFLFPLDEFLYYSNYISPSR